jgi:hypothetical protein
MNQTERGYCCDAYKALLKAAEDPAFFTVSNNFYKTMHSRVIGLLAEAAFRNGFRIEVGHSWELAPPLPPEIGKKRAQLHYAPDLTLYASDYQETLGFVDYESTDITRYALKKKLYFIKNIKNPPRTAEHPLYLFIVTVPDWLQRKGEDGSITKNDIPLLKDRVRTISQDRPEFSYCLVIIAEGTVTDYLFENGTEDKIA